jgi:hypothetical protein
MMHICFPITRVFTLRSTGFTDSFPLLPFIRRGLLTDHLPGIPEHGASRLYLAYCLYFEYSQLVENHVEHFHLVPAVVIPVLYRSSFPIDDHSAPPMGTEPADVVSVLLVFLTVVYDLTSKVDWPKYPKSIWQSLSSPFQNFLTLEDLAEPVGDRASRSRLKAAALVGLALLQCAGFLGCFVHTWVSGQRDGSVLLLLLSLAWVRVLSSGFFAEVYVAS